MAEGRIIGKIELDGLKIGYELVRGGRWAGGRRRRIALEVGPVLHVLFHSHAVKNFGDGDGWTQDLAAAIRGEGDPWVGVYLDCEDGKRLAEDLRELGFDSAAEIVNDWAWEPERIAMREQGEAMIEAADRLGT